MSLRQMSGDALAEVSKTCQTPPVAKKIGDNENAALTIPLNVSGMAEDLDVQLGPTLMNFVLSHLELKNTLCLNGSNKVRRLK